LDFENHFGIKQFRCQDMSLLPQSRAIKESTFAAFPEGHAQLLMVPQRIQRLQESEENVQKRIHECNVTTADEQKKRLSA
jgi:hypothetical protein